ncbi:hypothetical protein [Chryseobacterium sp. JUb7]|uniref:hypothetical protein n=1 Tax=Chryseobacterium sp. JUb7 TaxID=2940599 RepID=UPI00216A708F|nr:hypothetical protein [Chryseobacterium sp. JUb7]MCS3532550.1 hypothetical protein [Chryseobacterium sp. JUb7]
MKPIKNNKKFDLSNFEKLSTQGEILKGGFSATFVGGKKEEGILPDIGANIGDCGVSNTCTNTCNMVKGCGG